MVTTPSRQRAPRPLTAPARQPGTGGLPRAGHTLASAAAQRARARIARSAWRALKHPQFRWYFAGSLISNFGTWFQNTAQVLLAYQLTHSVFAVGVVTFAQFSSSLVLGPWAAVVASRMGGRRMLIAAQLASAAIAGGLAALQWSGQLHEQSLIVGALGLGLAFTFALPVQTALVPRLVDADDTEAAMAMNSVSYNAGRAAAPALCVLVIITIGFGWAFAINAISFVIFASALILLRPQQGSTRRHPARARDGLSIALQRPRIALLLAIVAAVTLADDPVLILGPALAHQVGVSNDWAGYFLSALGCGTVCGSLRPTTGLQARDTSRRSQEAVRSLLILVGAIALFAAGISPWVCLVAAFVAGAAALRTGALTQAQLVWHSPAPQVASVMALWAIAWAGTKPLASLADGSLASAYGVRVAALVLVAPALVLAVFELKLPGETKEAIKQAARDRGARLAMTRLIGSPIREPVKEHQN